MHTEIKYTTQACSKIKYIKKQAYKHQLLKANSGDVTSMSNAEARQLQPPLTLTQNRDAATHLDGGSQALYTVQTTKPHPCIYTSGFRLPRY